MKLKNYIILFDYDVILKFDTYADIVDYINDTIHQNEDFNNFFNDINLYKLDSNDNYILINSIKEQIKLDVMALKDKNSSKSEILSDAIKNGEVI